VTVFRLGTSRPIQFAADLLARGGIGRAYGIANVADDLEPKWLDRALTLVDDAEMTVLLAGASAADVALVDSRVDAERLLRDTEVTVVLAEWHGRVRTDLMLAAETGLMSVTGAPDAEPLYGVGHRLSYAAGAYICAASLLHRLGLRSDTAEHGRLVTIEISRVMHMIGDHFNPLTLYSGHVQQRCGRLNIPHRPTDMYRCKDGWVLIYARLPSEWSRLARALDMVDLLDDPRYATVAGRLENEGEIDRRVNEWLSTRTRAEVLDVARGAHLPCAPVLDPHEAFEFLRVNRGEWPIPNAIGRSLDPSVEEDASTSDSAAPRQLAGLRVVELTTGWAGPTVGRVLAALGADVVKVESPRAWDSWRGEAHPTAGLAVYPDNDPGPDPINRNALFNTVNRGKAGLALDLGDDADRNRFLELVSDADVVVQNLKSGALEKLGVDYERLREVNPSLVMLSIAAVSERDPLVGWGPTIEALCGMASRIGYPDGKPMNSGVAALDPMTGIWGLALLAAQLQTGLPGHISTSLLESGLAFFPEPRIDAAFDRRLGNAHPTLRPHGCFRVVGDDQWVVVAGSSDHERDHIVRTLGLSISPSEDSAEVWNAAVGEALAGLESPAEVDRMLDALGDADVAATRVLEFSEALDGARQREDLVDVDHPSTGVRPHPMLPGETDEASRDRRSPRLGEHDDFRWTARVDTAS